MAADNSEQPPKKATARGSKARPPATPQAPAPKVITPEAIPPSTAEQDEADGKTTAAETEHLDATTRTARAGFFQRIKLLPAHLRKMIWQVHVEHHVHPQTRAGYVTVDDTADDGMGQVTAAGKVKLEYEDRYSRVTMTPVDFVFGTTLTNNPALFRQWFSEAANMITFDFGSATAITRFARVLRRYFLPGTLPGGIRVSFTLFSGAEFRGMSDWGRLTLAHGNDFKAHEHVLQYTNAVQSIVADINPNADAGVTTDLQIRRPWRDYGYLRGATASLRSNKGKVEIRLPSLAAWEDSIEDPHLHMALTIVSVQGMRMNKRQDTFTDAAAERLVDVGCRGFKGQ